MSRNTKNSDVIQKYCKVCHDAGKSESEYRSHFIRETRDPNSKIMCPTLLALECKFCFKKGHTVKYCLVLKEKDRTPEKKAPKKTTEEKKAKGNKPTNLFACLDDSDSEEDNNIFHTHFEHEIETPVEEFPQLSEPTTYNLVSNNYAAALSKTISKPVSKPVSKTLSKPAPWASETPKVSRINLTTWDSDDEEEDDY